MKPPLGLFQATTTEQESVWRLVQTINSKVGQGSERPLPYDTLQRAFERLWPALQDRLERIRDQEITEGSISRSDRDIIEEILETVRDQQRRFDDMEIQIALVEKGPFFGRGLTEGEKRARIRGELARRQLEQIVADSSPSVISELMRAFEEKSETERQKPTPQEDPPAT